MSLLLDIVKYLIDKHVVTADGADAFRDIMPDTPDNVVVLREYQGDPGVYYDTLVNRSVQISVRNVDADTARSKALSIYNALYSSNTIVAFTTTRWGQVHLRQTPFKIMTDLNGRAIYGFNIGVTTTNE